MGSAFKGARLRGLREAKGLRPDEVVGFKRGTIAKWENGHAEPSLQALSDLTKAMDATSDFFLGLVSYRNDEEAAAVMAFNVYSRQLNVSVANLERCRRVLKHPSAPRTVDDWTAFVEMVDLAVGQAPTPFRSEKRA